MPERTLYDEAMLLSKARLLIQDPEFKEGQVETISIPTIKGSMQRPWGIQGGFAVVYKFRTRSGRARALRCFCVPMKPDIQSRYERIGAYFQTHAPGITTEFNYYEQGIVLKETVQGQQQRRVYPVIEMEWVEGATLFDHVDELCKKRDQTTLGKLSEQWLTLFRTMRQAKMAHGDLAGVNVMVRKDGSLVLVDYDGVYIPDFAGMPQLVLGQRDYQHPLMTERKFNERMDDFSALVIHTALLALHLQPTLWDTYIHRSATGKMLDTALLFVQQDFLEPNQSALIHDLERINDPRLQMAVQALKQACQQPIDYVQFPVSLLDADYDKRQALVALEKAIRNGNEEQILQLWVRPLENFGPAQQHRPRVEYARQVLQALVLFRNVLRTGNMQQIVLTYDPLLDTCQQMRVEEREQLELARRFIQAFQHDDDDALIAVWEDIQASRSRGALSPTLQETARLALAQQRRTALSTFRLTLYNQRTKATQIIAAYNPILNDCRSITPQERELLNAANQFILMYQAVLAALQANNNAGDNDQIIASYDEQLASRFTDFTLAQQQRISQAMELKKLEGALQAKAHGFALRLARSIEATSRVPIMDERLSMARRRYVRQFDVRNVEIQLRGDTVYARWEWPTDDLIEFAVLAWRPDRWPLHPRKAEPGTIFYKIHRGSYAQQGGFAFKVGYLTQIYVQVYLAMPEYVSYLDEVIWLYSSGDDPTSRQVAARSHVVPP